jgi:hypothetical protein
METQLQKTIEAASQIEEIISKDIPTAPKERTFWTTALGIDEAVEMIRLNFEEAEKVVLKVDNPNNPARILAMVKIWDVKLAKEIREKFEEMWSEAKAIELT